MWQLQGSSGTQPLQRGQVKALLRILHSAPTNTAAAGPSAICWGKPMCTCITAKALAEW